MNADNTLFFIRVHRRSSAAWIFRRFLRTRKAVQILELLRRSKNELGAELNRSGSARAGDLAEVRAIDVRARIVPLRSIEHVESLATELELPSLADIEIAENRCVQVPCSGPAHEVSAEIPEFRQSAVFGAGLREALRRDQRSLGRVEVADRVRKPNPTHAIAFRCRDPTGAEPV